MRLPTGKPGFSEDGVTNLLEYLTLSGVLMILLVIMLFTVNAVFMEGPANNLCNHAFVDIGNGISTRIVDMYVISPANGTISTKFDIPDDVAGRDYRVEMELERANQQIVVSGGGIQRVVSIAGIGATKGVTGSTTGSGLNIIEYNSEGYD